MDGFHVSLDAMHDVVYVATEEGLVADVLGVEVVGLDFFCVHVFRGC